MDNYDLIKKRCKRLISLLDEIISEVKEKPIGVNTIAYLCNTIEKEKLPYLKVMRALEDKYVDKALKLLYENASEVVYNLDNKEEDIIVKNAIKIRELVKDLI